MTRGVTAAITFCAHLAHTWRGQRRIVSIFVKIMVNPSLTVALSCRRRNCASCQTHKRHGCGTELSEGFYVSKNQQLPKAAVGGVERSPVCRSPTITGNIPLHQEDY